MLGDSPIMLAPPLPQGKPEMQGILTSAVMAVNVIVNYQQKLSEFLANLAAESSQAGNVQKAE
ncbi:TPA: hypothetical protein ACH3X3_001930 [Trebouxia sp. C0006]